MYHFIANLTAGKGKSKRAFDAVSDLFRRRGVPFQVHPTDHAGHAREIAAALTGPGQEEVQLVVFGGDGTLNEVLNGIVCFDRLTLGVIPCGTGNDFARAANLRTDPVQAATAILDGQAGYVDFIDAGVRRALNCAGTGMDVDVLVRYASMKAFRGKLKYYASLLDTLLHLHFHRVRITLGQEVREEEVFMVAATNGTCIGGGMPLSPRSDVADGQLNVVLIHAMPRRKILPALLGFLKGKHIDKPYTEEHLVQAVKLEILDEGKTEVDGEVLEGKTLDCNIVRNTLRMVR